MILNVSTRTDIPAFYSEWFVQRIKEGFVLVRNPYNQRQVSEIKLTPDVVDCIVFCTKDPRPMMKYLPTLKALGYTFCFQMTLTPYDQTIETNIKNKEQLEDAFIVLSKQVGKEKCIWRYDPILVDDVYTVERHIQEFKRMITKLHPYINTIIISFITIYKRIEGLFKEVTSIQKREIASAFVKIASTYDISIQSCTYNQQLEQYGVRSTSCMDQAYLEKITGYPLDIEKNSNREYCHCCSSMEIGSYDSCNHGCRYCYACGNKEQIIRNNKQHDIYSPLLIGNVQPTDKVIKRKVESNKITQLSFKF